ncbi:unnamed protein product [Anisakis simplex]|uniref:MADF domain-containing protein n=1 Tax=Anisakis simplex TaxID=6269 RepID=A0A0M3K1A9_ANISI|nr:unnamed protein product [Anisakis simplex]
MESTKGGRNSTFNDSIVREVRRKPIVFDPSHPLHANSLKKQEAWNEIAANLDEQGARLNGLASDLMVRGLSAIHIDYSRYSPGLISVETVKTRWRTLRDRYTKERRRISLNGGESSFSYYTDLNFLDQCINDGRLDIGMIIVWRQNSVTVSSAVKLEAFEQASDAGDELDSKNDDNPRTEAEEVSHADDLEPSISRIGASADRHLSVQQQTRPNSGSESGAVSDPVIIDDNGPPKKRFRSAPLTISAECSSSSSAVDTLADALLGSAGAFMRSADALQRLVDSRPTSTAHRSSVAADAQRDADECFADFVCMSLKAIDNESRVHARIAIIHALAQFQT